MGCFDGYLFLSDLDGTLTTPEGIAKEDADAIRFFQEEGGLFTAATGRTPEHVEQFAADFTPNTYIIAINGTILYDPVQKQIVQQKSLDEGIIEAIEYARLHFPHMFALHTTYSISGHTNRFDPRSGVSFPDFAKTIPKPWYKMIICVEAAYSEAAMNELRNRFGDRYQFERSWPEGIEIHTQDSGKDDCIRSLRKRLPHVHTIIAAGDYENDIAMLKEADIGYAVGNALPHVMAVADRVTVPCTEHAIAHIIQDIYNESKGV